MLGFHRSEASDLWKALS